MEYIFDEYLCENIYRKVHEGYMRKIEKEILKNFIDNRFELFFTEEEISKLKEYEEDDYDNLFKYPPKKLRFCFSYIKFDKICFDIMPMYSSKCNILGYHINEYGENINEHLEHKKQYVLIYTC